jgi:hypothetical protein
MNGRVYDPAVGAFLSPDNIVQNATSTQSYNRYGYCLNNPLKYTDPSGWEWNAVASSHGGNTVFYNLGDYMTYLNNLGNSRPRSSIGTYRESGFGSGGTIDRWYSDYQMDLAMRGIYTPDNSDYFHDVQYEQLRAELANGGKTTIKYNRKTLGHVNLVQLVSNSSGTIISGEAGNIGFSMGFDSGLNLNYIIGETGISASSEESFTGYKGNRYYFESVRVRELNFGNFKHGAAMTVPGVGIFVGPGYINDVDLLKHEFGHILQYRKWGAKIFWGEVVPSSLMYANYANRDPAYSNLDYMSNWTEWSANHLSYKYFDGNFNMQIPVMLTSDPGC